MSIRYFSADELISRGARMERESAQVLETVKSIIERIRLGGDEALLDICFEIDKVRPNNLRVSKDEIDEALNNADPELIQTLKLAASNIEQFHLKQKQYGYIHENKPGIIMGRRVTPLNRVGIYIPGGTASYPSTVLMNAIPAKIAGVNELVMVSPPGKDGNIPPNILAAASIAGVDEIYKLGGAQAIAALAYGTKSISRADKITGPGNIYVATAKRLVYGVCDIDMIAGPSEILIIADESAKPKLIAADLLSQAEHDRLSACILLTTSNELAGEVVSCVDEMLLKLERREIAEESLNRHGAVVIVDSLELAASLSDLIAPEHLELMVKDPFALLPFIKNAGSIFLGENTPEALGDYLAGPNHTLPTSGAARFSSGLSVEDFYKKSTFLYYSRDALNDVREHVERFANSEGLQAHANSVKARFED